LVQSSLNYQLGWIHFLGGCHPPAYRLWFHPPNATDTLSSTLTSMDNFCSLLSRQAHATAFVPRLSDVLCKFRSAERKQTQKEKAKQILDFGKSKDLDLSLNQSLFSRQMSPLLKQHPTTTKFKKKI